MKTFSIGCNARGAMHTQPLPVDEQFRLVKSMGVFDHFDRMPQPGEEKEYLRAAQKHALPIRTGLWSYMVGRDEQQLEKNLKICKEGGAEAHDLMVLTKHAKGHVVTDQEVVDFYRLAYDLGGKVGLTIGFEVHINMWTEDFRRVSRVARMVQATGIPFNFVMDHSHVLLKIESPEEQDISTIREDVESGRLRIDPYEEGNVLDEWIGMGMTIWLQIRPVSPGGPKNKWAIRAEGGSWGRAVQYPFIKPGPGEWHSPWNAWRVEPCKEVVRRVLRHHRDNPKSPLKWITTDMLDMPDYGGGAKYSLIEQNAAIATWFRKTWDEIQAEKK